MKPQGKWAGLPGAPQDTRDRQAERKRAVRRRKRDAEYLRWVHGRPCLVCGKAGEVHHHPYKSHPGWDDRLVVPLCPDHHRGPAGIHGLAHDGFRSTYGYDLLQETRKLRAEYEGYLGTTHPENVAHRP